jgi:speckle-type POZ protein
MELKEADEDSESSANEPLGVFSEINSRFFNSGLFSDFLIICSDNVELPAHRCIMSGRNSVFEAMLQTNMIESQTKQLVLSDIDSPTMLEILRFIYTGKTENLDKLASSIYKAAHKYDLQKLKVSCASKLIRQLSKENVFDMLILARLYGEQELENECIDLMHM